MLEQLNEIRAGVKVPQNLQGPLDRIVLAGKKVMYSKETNEMAMQSLEGDGRMDEKLGKAISDLMVILFSESNKTMPPQLIIPAAILLYCEAVEFLTEGGMVEEGFDAGAALEGVVVMTLERFGVKPDQVEAEMQKFAQGGMINQDGVVRGQAPQIQTQPQQGV